MPAAVLVQLIIALGPPALGLIKDLVAVWSKPSLTPEEVNAICDRAQKTYDAYLLEAAARN